MKIISGRLKGRLIEMPKGIRPTSDKVREALFEILKDRIEGASFLDLYCGSGPIGIEALSRGVKNVSFVEKDARCIAILKKNLALLQLSKINIYARDALRWIKENKEGFDIVFLDPPYYKDMAKKTLIALSDCDILARNALIIIEAYKKDVLPEEAGTLKKIRTCKYGDTKLEFYKT